MIKKNKRGEERETPCLCLNTQRVLKRSKHELFALVSLWWGAGGEKSTNTHGRGGEGEEKEGGVKPTLVDRFEGGLLLRMVSYIAHP